MCRCCHRFKTSRFLDGISHPAPTNREWCFCRWLQSVPKGEGQLPQWITHPTCAGCIKKFYTPLTPGHPQYPKNPRPGDFFYIDIVGNIHRFGGMTGPKSTRPDPKDIEADQKKVADYINERQAKRDKELEESNKKAEEMLEKDLEEQKKEEAERKAKAKAFDAENLAKLTRTAEKFGFKMGPMP